MKLEWSGEAVENQIAADQRAASQIGHSQESYAGIVIRRAQQTYSAR